MINKKKPRKVKIGIGNRMKEGIELANASYGHRICKPRTGEGKKENVNSAMNMKYIKNLPTTGG